MSRRVGTCITSAPSPEKKAPPSAAAAIPMATHFAARLVLARGNAQRWLSKRAGSALEVLAGEGTAKRRSTPSTNRLPRKIPAALAPWQFNQNPPPIHRSGGGRHVDGPCNKFSSRTGTAAHQSTGDRSRAQRDISRNPSCSKGDKRCLSCIRSLTEPLCLPPSIARPVGHRAHPPRRVPSSR
jgi:hypothetical protein